MPPSPSLSPSWSTRRRRHPRRSAGSSPPRLDLPLRAFAAVQQHMERVQALVASCANLAQLRSEGVIGLTARPPRRRPHAEYRVLGECGKRDKRDGGGAEQERLTFLQTQQTRHLIDLDARQQCRLGRTSARPIARMLGLRLANLPGKIGGDVDSPSAVRPASAGARADRPPCQTACWAGTNHCENLPAAEPNTRADNRPIQDRREWAGSEFGRQIPVDFQADTDLNEDRGCPGHSSFSLAFSGAII
jgi:hypothetical protein